MLRFRAAERTVFPSRACRASIRFSSSRIFCVCTFLNVWYLTNIYISQTDEDERGRMIVGNQSYTYRQFSLLPIRERRDLFPRLCARVSRPNGGKLRDSVLSQQSSTGCCNRRNAAISFRRAKSVTLFRSTFPGLLSQSFASARARATHLARATHTRALSPTSRSASSFVFRERLERRVSLSLREPLCLKKTLS